MVEQSYGHSLQKLTYKKYLMRDQIPFANKKTLLQLKDCATSAIQCT